VASSPAAPRRKRANRCQFHVFHLGSGFFGRQDAALYGRQGCLPLHFQTGFNMTRNAFKMQLKPGVVVEYKKRHDEIWPELAAELKAAGISDYSIFLDEETLTLFAVQKLSDGNTASALPRSPIVRKWWDAMAPLMEVHPDHSPRRYTAPRSVSSGLTTF
jgi:L-rhamnose mutarotase